MIFANQTVCSTSLDSKYSILGSYLKASKGAGQDKLGGRGSGWMLNSLSHLSAPRPASRDSRGYSKEEEEDALMDSETKDYPQVTTDRRLTLGKLLLRLSFRDVCSLLWLLFVESIYPSISTSCLNRLKPK